MSWRIEQTDALNLLRELPNGWAQTCIAHPPRAGDPERALAILTETRRVLRDDGTLWVFLASNQLPLTSELREDGWIQQPRPAWARCREARLYLFTKRPGYFYADTIATRRRPMCVSASLQVRRAQTCLPAREHEDRLHLIKRCILAGSSLLACGECGAPYRRAHPGESAVRLRHSTCLHNNPGGCCLVLDPFYDRAGMPTAEAALCTGRSFLGITESASTGETR
jgi:hypothetical protein